jgi:hypothetical protein
MTLPLHQSASAPSDPRDCNIAPGGLATGYVVEGGDASPGFVQHGPLSEVRLYRIDQGRNFQKTAHGAACIG